MLKFGGGFILGFVAGFAALFVLIVLNGDYEEPTTVAPSIVAVADAPAQDTAPAAQPSPVVAFGDTVQQEGYALTVFAVEDPATRPGVFYKPEAGRKLVAVDFAVGNMAGEMFSSNELNAILIDSNGYLYSAANTMVEDSIELLEVAPQQSVRGWASFWLPDNAVPRSFKYEYGSSGIAIQIDLPRE